MNYVTIVPFSYNRCKYQCNGLGPYCDCESFSVHRRSVTDLHLIVTFHVSAKYERRDESSCRRRVTRCHMTCCHMTRSPSSSAPSRAALAFVLASCDAWTSSVVPPTGASPTAGQSAASRATRRRARTDTWRPLGGGQRATARRR